MTGLNYPDNLYADHEEAKARRVANQAPTGAYRAAPELSESERKLRTALAYVCHARDLINDALAIQPTSGSRPNQPEACNPATMREAKIAYDVACDRVRDWLVGDGGEVPRPPHGRIPKWHPDYVKPPNCDGLSARDIRSPRDHDEFLDGTEGERRDLRDYGSVFYRHEMKDGRLVVTHVPLETVYVANPSHPMNAEAIRDHDERLQGPEDAL